MARAAPERMSRSPKTTRPAGSRANAAATSSGPMPAGSPMVTPMRTGFEYHTRDARQTCMRLAALLLTLAAPAAAAHSGALPGEAFTFKFSVGPIESGRARMSVGLPVENDGRRLLAVHGQAETLPWLALVARMNHDYQLVLDTGTPIPVEG